MENKFCSQCGAPLEENAKFCTCCGNSVIEIPVMPKVETASWGWVLGTFFGAFVILFAICTII